MFKQSQSEVIVCFPRVWFKPERRFKCREGACGLFPLSEIRAQRIVSAG